MMYITTFLVQNYNFFFFKYMYKIKYAFEFPLTYFRALIRLKRRDYTTSINTARV